VCTCRNGRCNQGVLGDGKCAWCLDGWWGINCELLCTCQFGKCSVCTLLLDLCYLNRMDLAELENVFTAMKDGTAKIVIEGALKITMKDNRKLARH
jgi:hypothetical protein